jgi:hypothetical protein
MRLPTQSPLFWVHNKDRYLRQLLISDIEGDTGRSLIVYFTDCASNAQIDHMDDAYLVEQLLGAVQQNGVDLLLETNGGMTDATEKIVSVLANLAKDLRVIVPRRAKSNGTVIALTGKSILMGANSELGPIDPYIPLGPNGLVPAAFIINAQSQVDPLVFQIAQSAMNQTKKLATNVLKAGMLANIDVQRIEEDIVVKLSSRNHYHSHGSVIDHKEAAELGLEVEYLPPENELWQKIWLLRTMYEHDCKVNRLSKLFEGNKISSGISV